MARLKWGEVQPKHYAEAARAVAASYKDRFAADGTPNPPTLFVAHEGRKLPAKEVARTAYRLALGLPADAKIKFSSGEGTRLRLVQAGLDARRGPGRVKKAAPSAAEIVE